MSSRNGSAGLYLPTSLLRKLLSCILRYSVFCGLALGAIASHAAQCTQPLQLAAAANDSWSGWGNGLHNTRQATAGIDSGDLASLELRWAFGFPDAGSAIGNPVVQGDVLYAGSESGTVHALDANSGCTHWTFKAATGVRTAPALAQIGGRWLLFFGDRSAQVYALDAYSGVQVWLTKVEAHPAAILTGAPQYFQLADDITADRLLVPVSSSEEGIAAVPTYPCCSFRGSVVSLDAATGAVLWQQHTIQNPVQATGAQTQGPSGAAIWSAPTIDLANKRFYVTTGDAYSAPADIASDAVLGMDLASGKILWINPGTTDDIWTVACLGANAPDDCGPDQDYGSPGLLVSSADHRFLVTGQKSGYVRAFNLDGGSQRWRTLLVENPNEFGGKIVWGGASDAEQVYFGLGSGGIAALRISDGELQWFAPLSPSTERVDHPGQDGPLTVSDDLVISGGWDGMLRILSSKDGRELWSYDTVRSYESTNAVATSGGSMGAVGPVVAGRRLFVSTGYVGVKNGLSGNALLMFAPSGAP
jgi:polyvinyl alcohol dehydrogenase (cytochrome)